MHKIKQNGIAVIAALLMLAICATIAYKAMWNKSLLIQNVSIFVINNKIIQKLSATTEWAKSVLKNNIDIRKVKSFYKKIDNIELSGMVYALNGKLNINSLETEDGRACFTRLLNILFPNFGAQKIKTLLDDIKNILNKHKIIRIENLQEQNNISSEIYEKLKFYITALPSTGNIISINHALPETLASVSDISIQKSKELLECRGQDYFKSMGEFNKKCASTKGINLKNINAKDTFYMFYAMGKLKDQIVVIESLIKRFEMSAGKISTSIIWQETYGY